MWRRNAIDALYNCFRNLVLQKIKSSLDLKGFEAVEAEIRHSKKFEVGEKRPGMPSAFSQSCT